MPELESDPAGLIKQFYHNNLNFESRNELCRKRSDVFRIMTYNVHMWKNAKGDTINFDSMLDNILTLDPEILCLQEVVYHSKYMDRLYQTYDLLSGCMINPSYTPNMPYMLLMLIKKGLRTELSELNKEDVNFVSLCSTPSDCHLGQQTQIFHREPLSDGPLYAVNQEDKCFIKISLPFLDLIGTHLTPYDKEGTRRIQELDQIQSVINPDRKTIVLGDLNLINRQEYGLEFASYIAKYEDRYGLTNEVYRHLTEDLHWVDIYHALGTQRRTLMNYSNWTGFRVDQIFLVGWTSQEIFKVTNTCMYYSNASDHNPLVLDLPQDLVGHFKNTQMTQIKPKPMISTDLRSPIQHYFQQNPVLTPQEFRQNITRWTQDEINRPNPKIHAMHRHDLIPKLVIRPQRIMLFNVQPLYAIDWFNLEQMPQPPTNPCVKTRPMFSDPFVTDNTGGRLVMGAEDGIYFSASIKHVINTFLFQLQVTYEQIYGHPKGVNVDQFLRTCLLYTFSLDPTDPEITSHLMQEQETGLNFNQYKEVFAREYDLLLLEDKPIIKVTTRHFDPKTKCHPLLQLEGLYLCYYDGKWTDPVPLARDIWSRMGKKIPVSLQFGNPFYLTEGDNVSLTAVPITWEVFPKMLEGGRILTNKRHSRTRTPRACDDSVFPNS